MTTAIRALLETFDSLSDAERQEAAVEILRRVMPPRGDLPDETLLKAADALFCMLDAEEETNAGS